MESIIALVGLVFLVDRRKGGSGVIGAAGMVEAVGGWMTVVLLAGVRPI